MEKGKGILLAGAFAYLFSLLDSEWPKMFHLATPIGIAICSILIIVILLSYTPIWQRLLGGKSIAILPPTSPIPDNYYQNIINIKGKEPSNYPPAWINIVLNVCYLIMLTAVIILLGIEKTPVHFTPIWIFFFLFLVVLPLWFLVDTNIIEPRQNRLGKSKVAMPKTIILSSDIDMVFNKCLKVLDMMKTTKVIVERPKFIKAWQPDNMRGNRVITVNLSRRRGKEAKTKIDILSDSQWTTTKWDFFHGNRKNVDTFERLITSDAGHIERD